ncbi:PEP/pyruvate-binding domain-containing protein [Mediterraneibacter glycyrrhizinilyticus]|uniref:PEP/pyruvate-binding domain-containing protein n=1 Tax=Mediterraneibacter glycyrrhizinilyticus TaxID=342942 RepID=UPI0025AA5041|nr:PEP/pyruvate-binding domain-containing protein [Mediterraneibacter glycyrrhizinilyticus]MDN0061058.1 PEP/pyruvate-binding domain-containing protein [Mediterraneibacter glycyrrhizinilyticus]
MGAFDKIKSGLPGMDELLNYIRMGDNVVWSVADLEDFKFFAIPFAKQAIRDGRNLIYMRFADHEPLLTPRPGLKICEFDPDKGFEAFTVDIHDRITEEGKDAFYVFDSLSSLQSVWYTDLMMGNFFRVTCPYLFQLDTVAYFPLLRGRHSFEAVARIRDTTQLLLDVYRSGRIYLHPLKVWNRYSTKMFLPHSCSLQQGEEYRFETVDGGVAMSRYYQLVEEEEEKNQDQNYDSHDRFFSLAKLDYQRGIFGGETERQIIESTLTKDRRLQEMIRKYFRPRDYFQLRDRMVGSGSLGGKACGMLLARKIIHTELPEYRKYFEPHDSFYIGSDVFYTYIVSNNCWETRIGQRTEEGYFTKAEALKDALLSGTFPPDIREKFRTLLEYFGQSPIIVRSSSFLEDGFGNAFAGKYESVFCVNQGSPEERMEAFETAVRTVYASTMDISALEYRKQRGLQHSDEQMAVLVQRVSGSYHGELFFPAAAGVGYSYSSYRWNKYMDPAAGLLRIVAGLGTRAVDRPDHDYPRLANLDRPAVPMQNSVADRHRFSQRIMDVLDTEKNELTETEIDSMLENLPLWYKKAVMERDYEAEAALKRMNRPRQVWFTTCQGLLENREFTELMQKMLKTLDRVYGNPVDIEYTVNLDEQGEFVVNLLQCRPLYTGGRGTVTEIPELPEKNVFFRLKDSAMGSSVKEKIDVVVQIDARAYYEYPYALKPQAAEAVGAINTYYKGKKKHILLMTPGRVGTSSPELGVPVSFAQISGFCGICEVSDNRAGYMPELSYGSHMFQDLVEAGIFYCALWGDERTVQYNEAFFGDLENLFPVICPERKELAKMVRVSDPEDLWYWNNEQTGETVCGILHERIG